MGEPRIFRRPSHTGATVARESGRPHTDAHSDAPSVPRSAARPGLRIGIPGVLSGPFQEDRNWAGPRVHTSARSVYPRYAGPRRLQIALLTVSGGYRSPQTRGALANAPPVCRSSRDPWGLRAEAWPRGALRIGVLGGPRGTGPRPSPTSQCGGRPNRGMLLHFSWTPGGRGASPELLEPEPRQPGNPQPR